MDAVTRLLSDLVAIPSVNPMGRALAGPGVLEEGMSTYLENWFRELGVPCERQTIAPGRDNLLARYEAKGGRKTVLFDAHQDTVP
ncbi:M20 family peptidase, partial [Singulisphaera rosea]